MDSDYSYLGGVRSGGCFVALGQRDQLATARVEHGHGDLLQLRGVARVRGPGHCRHPAAHTAHSQTVASLPSSTTISHSTRYEASVHDGDLYFLFEKYNVNSIDYNIFFC